MVCHISQFLWSVKRYKGWLDAVNRIWMIVGGRGLFIGSVQPMPSHSRWWNSSEILMELKRAVNEVTNL
ncbi:hypothetical protein MKW98_017087 [Papaver atlanticum]|uniref:Uncharacterized protein n=1 Tax=Papaver atlanticum TaxID=357466 RepID=A0AAD4TKC3_9MAGN|nr:hypothetical protein MKW98_017087 [Papaver atlanticum]